MLLVWTVPTSLFLVIIVYILLFVDLPQLEKIVFGDYSFLSLPNLTISSNDWMNDDKEDLPMLSTIIVNSSAFINAKSLTISSRILISSIQLIFLCLLHLIQVKNPSKT